MPRSPFHPLPALGVLMTAIIVIGGCQRVVDDAGVDAGGALGVRTSSPAARAVVRSPSREVPFRPGATLSLPVDFPQDVFLPSGYTVDSVMDRDGLQVVSLRAPGRVSALFGDARDHMRARGWNEALAMQTAGDSAMLSFEKGSRAAVLSFNQGPQDNVTLSVQVRGEDARREGSAL